MTNFKVFKIILLGVSFLFLNTIFAYATSTELVLKKTAIKSTVDNTFEEEVGKEEMADNLYSLRGVDISHAQAAADIYEELAKETEDNLIKAKMVMKQVTALYYVAGQEKSEDLFKKAYLAADAIVQLFADPEDDEQEELKTWALYWYGASLAQTLQYSFSGKNAVKVENTMTMILELGYEDIYHYGAHRVLGRIRMRIPGFLSPVGNKKKALVNMEAAFNGTLFVNDKGETLPVSVYGLNNLYYADILIHFKKRVQACEILNTFVQQDPEALMDTRIPETKSEIALAMKKRKSRKFKCHQ